MKIRLLVSTLLLLVPATAARAADDTPISAERPGFTNGTDTVSLGHLQLETGYQYSRDGSAHEHQANNGAQFRYPVSERAEIRLGVPAYDWTGGGSVPGIRGLEDASVSAKWRFLNGVSAKRPSLALIISTTLPTGSKELRENHLQPQAALEGHLDLSDKWSLETDFVSTSARSSGQRFDQYAGALNIGYSVSPSLALFMETYRITPTDLDSVSGSYADGGLTYLIGKNTQIDLNGGTGLTRGVRSGFFVGFGIAHRFR